MNWENLRSTKFVWDQELFLFNGKKKVIKWEKEEVRITIGPIA